eukprot:CAMPEP_0174863182 /NCGR_PEP_ID=MMETSP1114-20130205/55690_1 /TAXON_ID=312471 /ORGANISM="Neobodo designis, Strain CCAP 1951/1" /LENGTH=118 /DNA_ID=CAMNT_0016098245 /DNA_START=642 /DNA_END=998 /DNA_ORIENTATION=-
MAKSASFTVVHTKLKGSRVGGDEPRNDDSGRIASRKLAKLKNVAIDDKLCDVWAMERTRQIRGPVEQTRHLKPPVVIHRNEVVMSFTERGAHTLRRRRRNALKQLHPIDERVRDGHPQ